MRSDQKLGLVLSGGGLRGIAHIGLIRLLEELRIEPVDSVDPIVDGLRELVARSEVAAAG